MHDNRHSAYDVKEYGFRHLKTNVPSISDKPSHPQVTVEETSNTELLEHRINNIKSKKAEFFLKLLSQHQD
jgi:hypothetical protein